MRTRRVSSYYLVTTIVRSGYSERRVTRSWNACNSSMEEKTVPNPPPMRVDQLTPEVVREVATIATALPYRSSAAVDSERVYWIDIAGRERVGIAYTADTPGGPYWMVAFARADKRRVSKGTINQVVGYLTGGVPEYELAPPFDGAPEMTMVRVKAD